jgi:FKBP-type peptidyl-prolyl cis-trans isomerase FklB
MRKIIIAALVLVTGASFNAISAQKLQSRIDTLSYTLGMTQTQGLTDYLTKQLNIDPQYMDDFIKGLKESVDNSNDKRKAAYYAGTQIGMQITGRMLKGINSDLFGNDSTQRISQELFMKGFICGVTGKDGLMTVQEANKKAQALIQSVKSEEALKKYGDNKAAGEKFLAENAKKKDIKTLKGGIQYKVIQEGKGAIPTATQKIKVHYEGRTLDGKVFDSSYKRGEPAEFRCNQLIKGWMEALTYMPVGSIWEVYIPQELAYGERQQGNDIKPFSMLIFKIELLDILDK